MNNEVDSDERVESKVATSVQGSRKGNGLGKKAQVADATRCRHDVVFTKPGAYTARVP